MALGKVPSLAFLKDGMTHKPAQSSWMEPILVTLASIGFEPQFDLFNRYAIYRSIQFVEQFVVPFSLTTIQC